MSDREYEAGKVAGKKWAKGDATAKELTRLIKYYFVVNEGDELNWLTCFSVVGKSQSNSAAEQFYYTCNPDDEGDKDAARAFWSHQAQSKPAFVHGFAEGAVDTWDSQLHAVLKYPKVLDWILDFEIDEEPEASSDDVIGQSHLRLVRSTED